MGVMRHADAGYERAIEVARQRGVRIPMRDEPQPMDPASGGPPAGATEAGPAD
jgi:urocanate hydratase